MGRYGLGLLALIALALAGCAEPADSADGYWQERDDIYRDELVALETYRDAHNLYGEQGPNETLPSLKLAEASRDAAQAHQQLVERMDALDPPQGAQENHDLIMQGFEARAEGYTLQADCIEQVEWRICVQAEQHFELAQHHYDEAEEALPEGR